MYQRKKVPFHYGDIFLNEVEISYENLYGISLAMEGIIDRNRGIVRFCALAPE